MAGGRSGRWRNSRPSSNVEDRVKGGSEGVLQGYGAAQAHGNGPRDIKGWPELKLAKGYEGGKKGCCKWDIS